MRLPRLDIHSQLGALAARTHNAKLQGGRGEMSAAMKGNNSAAVELRTTPPRILIDQTRSRESMGIDTPLESWRKCAERGTQHFIERIGGIVREGLAIMKIERGGGGGAEAMARIAANKGYKDVRLTLNMVAPPEIVGVLGDVEITDGSEEVSINWSAAPDRTRYTAGNVNFAWAREPSIEIKVIPGENGAIIPNVYGQGLRLDIAL